MTVPRPPAAVGCPPGAAATAYLHHLQVERGLAANTLQSYRRDLTRYLEFLDQRGVRDLAEVSAQTVGDWVAWLRTGDDNHRPLAAASVARTVAAVRGLHRFGVAEGWLDADPSRELNASAPPRRLPKALALDDVTRMIEAAAFDGTPVAMRDAALLELLYGTGARVSEALALRVDDVVRDDGCVLLRGKGGKQRLVPVGRFARAAVERYLQAARPILDQGGARGALFLNTRGRPLSRQSAWAVIRHAAHRAGVDEQIGPHTLRH